MDCANLARFGILFFTSRTSHPSPLVQREPRPVAPRGRLVRVDGCSDRRLTAPAQCVPSRARSPGGGDHARRPKELSLLPCSTSHRPPSRSGAPPASVVRRCLASRLRSSARTVDLGARPLARTAAPNRSKPSRVRAWHHRGSSTMSSSTAGRRDGARPHHQNRFGRCSPMRAHGPGGRALTTSKSKAARASVRSGETGGVASPGATA
jgi:hypothetical protein